uniref:Uncharacterized protein n=1 Tax=Knipowitschia caucasica TaxID=637954 RepID=A0AAV2J157_KNICA
MRGSRSIAVEQTARRTAGERRDVHRLEGKTHRDKGHVTEMLFTGEKAPKSVGLGWSSLADRYHYVNIQAGSKQQQVLRRADGTSPQLVSADWALRSASESLGDAMIRESYTRWACPPGAVNQSCCLSPRLTGTVSIQVHSVVLKLFIQLLRCHSSLAF